MKDIGAAAGWLADTIKAAIGDRGACALCLSGGTTPVPVYRQLAAAGGLDWSKVRVFFADERAVPPDHKDSNYRMIKESLLTPARVPEASVFRMKGEAPDLDRAAEDYARLLPRRLDVLLLGMGPDGHTASLFPGSAALGERERRVVAVQDAPKPPPRRLTITPPVIGSAREVCVLVTGAAKAEMAARVLEGALASRLLPAQLARHGVWFLDRAAASRLTAAP